MRALYLFSWRAVWLGPVLTLLAFADDMAVVTATARQPLPDAPNDARANHVLHDATDASEANYAARLTAVQHIALAR